MKRYWFLLAGFALLFVVFGFALKRAPEKQFVASALINKPAPPFNLPDLLKPGSTVDSNTFKGRWTLVNVWGTWCPECRLEHSVLLDIQKQGNVTIVGLNYKDEDDKAREWLAQLGNPYEAVAVDRDAQTALDYGVYGAPESFLINPQGIIVHKTVGVVTLKSWQDTMLPMIQGAAK